MLNRYKTPSLKMSSFKVTISLESNFTSQELAEFFSALASSERGNVEPLVRILHPVEPPPPPPPAVIQPEPEPEQIAPPVEPVPEPPTQNVRNTQWERCNITLVNDATITAVIEAINSGAFISPSSSVSWRGSKHHPNAHHNQRILDALRNAHNRTLSFTSIGAQAGIPDKEKLKSYLREMEKQSLITATRITGF
jgi:hypothetical protein